MQRCKFTWVRRRGSIEGLPLQLLIMIVIAAVGLGILLAWMNSINNQKGVGTICVYSSYAAGYDRISGVKVTASSLAEEAADPDPANIWIKVYDTSGSPLNGASVTLEGCNVMYTGITEHLGGAVPQDGVATGIDISACILPPDVVSGNIMIKVAKTDFGVKSVALSVERSNG